MNQHRKDKNQNEICEQLSKLGIGFWEANQVGFGFPDLVVYYGGRNYFIEIKFDKTSKLTPAQRKFHNYNKQNNGQICVCMNVKQVLDVIGYDSFIKTP